MFGCCMRDVIKLLLSCAYFFLQPVIQFKKKLKKACLFTLLHTAIVSIIFAHLSKRNLAFFQKKNISLFFQILPNFCKLVEKGETSLTSYLLLKKLFSRLVSGNY